MWRFSTHHQSSRSIYMTFPTSLLTEKRGYISWVTWNNICRMFYHRVILARSSLKENPLISFSSQFKHFFPGLLYKGSNWWIISFKGTNSFLVEEKILLSGFLIVNRLHNFVYVKVSVKNCYFWKIIHN